MPPLPEAFVGALNRQPFWREIMSDGELFPEYRAEGPALTVYYRGAAMIRELSHVDDRFEATCHVKYLPIDTAETVYAKLICTPQSLGFELGKDVRMIPLGAAQPDVIRRFKDQIKRYCGREGDLVQELCVRHRVVDQEISLNNHDRVDLAIACAEQPRVRLVEVKQVDDKRLRPKDGAVPEVVAQVQRYAVAVQERRAELVERFGAAVQAKRQLEIAGFDDWPAVDEKVEVDDRVTLAIGGCDEATVSAIGRREGRWSWLGDPAFGDCCVVEAFGKTKKLC